jgi:cobalt-zinc-cadmium efflux system membrane fusion protein
MKKHFVYINKILMLILFVVIFSIPVMNYAKAEEEKHADHKKYGDEHDEDEAVHEEGIIKLDEEAQEMIQLKTATVEKRLVEYRLKVFGKVAKDTEEHSYVTADQGIVEKIHVDLGAAVEKGSALLAIRKSDGSVQDILSENTGVILAIYVKRGDHVDRLKSLMSIVNIDKLRVTVDVYEKDIGFVKIGQKAEIESIAFSGKKFLGEVVYISPQVEEESQAIKVRIDVDNSEHLLRLGMFVAGELIYDSDKEVPAILQSAVQELNGKDIVFVKEGENKFSLREVTLGQSFGDYVEIRNGVDENEQVVTQGSFNLKSEQGKESFGDGHAH